MRKGVLGFGQRASGTKSITALIAFQCAPISAMAGAPRDFSTDSHSKISTKVAVRGHALHHRRGR